MVTSSALTPRPVTMSSVDIAKRAKKAHKHVLADIRKMLAELELRPAEFSARYTDAQGKQRECFHLPFREFSILVTGYSVQLRADLFDAWQKLENERRPQPVVTIQSLLDNPPQLLALAQGFALQVEDLKRDKAVMQQDVDVMDRFGRADETFGVRVAASMLDQPERKFVDWLMANKWAYRQNGSRRLMAYADKQRAGYLKNIPEPYRKADGEDAVRETLAFKMPGLIKLARIFNVTLLTPQRDLLEGTAARPRT